MYSIPQKYIFFLHQNCKLLFSIIIDFRTKCEYYLFFNETYIQTSDVRLAQIQISLCES